MTRVIDQASVTALNARFEQATAAEILAFAAQEFAGEISFANSFGLEDVVIQHQLYTASLGVESFVLDTGRLPAETYDLIERFRIRYDLKFRLLSPKAELLEPFTEENGPNSFYQSIALRKTCCAIRKLEPLARALDGKKAWITGLRREQSGARARLEIFELDDAGRLKIAPIAAWTVDQVWAYVREHKVPYNVLHDRGYPSVGCAPCTRAIEAGEDLRAGRWWWELDQQRECGLHTHSAVSNTPSKETQDAG